MNAASPLPLTWLAEPTWEGKTTQKLFNILNRLLWPIWPPEVLIGPVAEEDKGVLGVTPTQRPSAMTAEAGKCWYILHLKLHQSRGLVLTERHSWKRLKAGGSCVNMWCGRWLQGLQWFRVSWDAASWDVDLCIQRASECLTACRCLCLAVWWCLIWIWLGMGSKCSNLAA